MTAEERGVLVQVQEIPGRECLRKITQHLEKVQGGSALVDTEKLENSSIKAVYRFFDENIGEKVVCVFDQKFLFGVKLSFTKVQSIDTSNNRSTEGLSTESVIKVTVTSTQSDNIGNQMVTCPTIAQTPAMEEGHTQQTQIKPLMKIPVGKPQSTFLQDHPVAQGLISMHVNRQSAASVLPHANQPASYQRTTHLNQAASSLLSTPPNQLSWRSFASFPTQLAAISPQLNPLSSHFLPFNFNQQIPGQLCTQFDQLVSPFLSSQMGHVPSAPKNFQQNQDLKHPATTAGVKRLPNANYNLEHRNSIHSKGNAVSINKKQTISESILGGGVKKNSKDTELLQRRKNELARKIMRGREKHFENQREAHAQISASCSSTPSAEESISNLEGPSLCTVTQESVVEDSKTEGTNASFQSEENVLRNHGTSSMISPNFEATALIEHFDSKARVSVSMRTGIASLPQKSKCTENSASNFSQSKRKASLDKHDSDGACALKKQKKNFPEEESIQPTSAMPAKQHDGVYFEPYVGGSASLGRNDPWKNLKPRFKRRLINGERKKCVKSLEQGEKKFAKDSDLINDVIKRVARKLPDKKDILVEILRDTLQDFSDQVIFKCTRSFENYEKINIRLTESVKNELPNRNGNAQVQRIGTKNIEGTKSGINGAAIYIEGKINAAGKPDARRLANNIKGTNNGVGKSDASGPANNGTETNGEIKGPTNNGPGKESGTGQVEEETNVKGNTGGKEKANENGGNRATSRKGKRKRNVSKLKGEIVKKKK